MRWFKHLTTAHDDECMAELLDEFGPEGYGVWWIILEKIAAQMDKSDRCSARYSLRKWAKTCGISVKKFQKTVVFLSKLEKLSIKYCEKNSDFLIINCPNLLKFRDEYSKKSRQTPNNRRTKSGATPDQDTEAEAETKKQKKTFSENSNEFRLAVFLLNHIRKHKPDFKQPNLQAWAKSADAILRIDGRDIEKVKAVIVWSQSDEFWQGNVLSMSKLRTQFDTLEVRMRNGKSKKVVADENAATEKRMTREELEAFLLEGVAATKNQEEFEAWLKPRCMRCWRIAYNHQQFFHENHGESPLRLFWMRYREDDE